MNRTLLQLRSLLFRSGIKRADWIRRKKLFGSIGENVMIQDFRLPYNMDMVYIGNNVRIASDVSLITHDAAHHMLNLIPCPQKNTADQKYYKEKTGKIIIGDNVFIGAKSLILYDVTIANNVIVGAGSIVTKDLPGNSVCAGVPCKRIGDFEAFCQKRKNI